MKRILIPIAGAALATVLSAGGAQASPDGAALFQQKCVGCHTVGGGRAVGPDLKGVTERRDPEWLASFIAKPDQMLASGDTTTAALVEEYNMPMPNVGVTAEETAAIVAYLRGGSGGSAAAAEPAKAKPAPAGPGVAERGAALFTGERPLEAGGPSCISCHHAGSAALGGGTLAKDLTEAYARYGEAGLGSALESLPFPLMKTAYAGKALTPAEVADLLAYFKHTSEKKPAPAPNGTVGLLGAAGTLTLFGAMGLLWPRRRQSVREKLQGEKR